MIEITIKTLDSRNHAFSVGDEFTVKQLKEHIAEPVNVPAESQRLIYCGRVLLDDKKLSEYDVHGKVIHLVQRAPPGSSGSGGVSGEASTRSTTNPSARRPWRTVINPGRVDGGNHAMYLGAMAFPADLMDAQGITMPQPRHGLSQSRLSVARTMLRRARYTLQNLENPTHQESPGEVNSNNIQTEENLSSGVSAAAADTAAVFAAAVNAFVRSGSQGPSEGGLVEQVIPPEEVVTTSSRDNDASSEQPISPEENSTNSQQTPSGSSGGARPRYPRTSSLAELVVKMRDVNRRLQPFLDQYYELMRDDPTLENPTEADRLFTQVSEMMHFMAHAYHALSDVMCDFSQPPPRFLRCRPVLIQHSAVLQTGIPMQAQFNLSAPSGQQSNLQQGGGASGGSLRSGAGSEGVSSSTATASAPQEEEVTTTDEAPASNTNSSSSQQHQTPEGLNLGSGNFEFFMDVGPSSITIDSVEATVVTSAGTSSTEPTGITASGNFPWGSPPAPEFFQNLMQALASQIIGPGSGGGPSSTLQSGSGAATGASSSSEGGSSGASGAAASAPSPAPPQARVTTATHPTTATQTRSTSRPHVHFAPGIQGMGGQTFFDPFLPCNSHHIRGPRRRSSGLASEASGAQAVPDEVGGVASGTTSGGRAGGDHQPASTSASTDSPPRGPPHPETVFNLLSNVLGNPSVSRQSGQSHSVIRILPRDITILLQGPQFQGLANIPSVATVAELLQGLPDHTYTEGQSIFMDLFMTLARNLRVSEVLNMGASTSNVLVSLRPVLSQFVRQRLLQGRNPTPELISEAIDKINEELRPFMDSIQVPMREDVDLVATINQLNHRTFPLLISDVLEGDNANYSRSIPNICNNYARTIVLILLHCSQNGQQGLEPIFSAIARRMIIGVPNPFQNWSISQIVNQLRTLAHDPSSENIQQYLVMRAPQEATSSETKPSSAPEPEPDPVVDSSNQLPMEIEHEEITSRIIESEPLPDVIIEAEPWHNGLPPEWVPIITRDRERQRRQAVQGPLSEAYLSGMPSKRRKVVNSSKPHGSIARVISESMATALGAAGVASVEGVAETAGNDLSLRAAYREQVRSTVEATVRSHPDYKPEKYPNTAKFFDKK